MPTERITLYYREGSSDKIYQASLEESGGGFIVNFAFGRRGTTLQSGTKTAVPVPFADAKKIFDKLVKEKTAKGYSPGADGTPYVGTDDSDRSTGIVPQLLNPIEEGEVEKLIADSKYWMQQKLDGKRVMLRRHDKIVGINRKGLVIGLPDSILSYAALTDAKFLLDGEAIGDTFHAFDLLELNGADYRGRSYRERYEALVRMLGTGNDSIKMVSAFRSEAEKREEYARLKRANAEGVVFKRHDATYSPGRPASGGSQLKFKFVATASLIVSKVNAGKRSVELRLLDGTRRVGVGNVTIPPNAAIPIVGAVVEVRYLYAYKEGSLFQPVFIGVRDDIEVSDCVIGQLKYRPEEDDQDGEK